MPPSSRHRRQRDEDRRVFTPRRIRRIEGAALLLVGTVALILATLRPTTATAGTLCLFVCGRHAAVDALANVLLFIPIGAGLALLGAPWRTAIVIGVATTVVVETLQLALPLGRVASLLDLITNTVGTATGFYLAEHRRAIAYPRSQAALRYAVAMGTAWLLALTVTAIALLPSVPDGEYAAQWSPALARFDRHTGRVIAAHVADVSIPDGPVAQGDRLRRALRQGVRVEASIEPGAATRRLAPMVRLIRVDSAEIFVLGQREGDLLFRSRVRGTDMRFVTPMVAMPNAFSGLDANGSAGVLAAGGGRERGRLRVGRFGREAILQLHAGAGWLLFFPPASTAQAFADLLSAAWAGAPLFVIAYWAGRRARRRARRAGDAMRRRGTGGQILMTLPVLFGLAILGLAGISALFGLSQPAWTVWMGAVGAIGAGLTVGASLALAHDDREHGSPRHAARTGEAVPRATEIASA